MVFILALYISSELANRICKIRKSFHSTQDLVSRQNYLLGFQKNGGKLPQTCQVIRIFFLLQIKPEESHYLIYTSMEYL